MQKEAMEAGLAGLEGRRSEAITGFRDTSRRLSEVGMVLEVALNGLLAVQVLGPADGGARALAEEAREIFGRLGSRPFLRQVDDALAGVGGGQAVAMPASEKVGPSPRS